MLKHSPPRVNGALKTFLQHFMVVSWLSPPCKWSVLFLFVCVCVCVWAVCVCETFSVVSTMFFFFFFWLTTWIRSIFCFLVFLFFVSGGKLELFSMVASASFCMTLVANVGLEPTLHAGNVSTTPKKRVGNESPFVGKHVGWVAENCSTT